MNSSFRAERSGGPESSAFTSVLLDSRFRGNDKARIDQIFPEGIAPRIL